MTNFVCGNYLISTGNHYHFSAKITVSLAWQAILIFIINIYKKKKSTLWRTRLNPFLWVSWLLEEGRLHHLHHLPSSLSNMTFNMVHAKHVIIRVKKYEENSRKYDYRIVSHGTMEKRQLFHKDTGLSNAANHCLVWRCYFIFLFWLLSSFLSCSLGSDCFRTLTNDYDPTSLAFW